MPVGCIAWLGGPPVLQNGAASTTSVTIAPDGTSAPGPGYCKVTRSTCVPLVAGSGIGTGLAPSPMAARELVACASGMPTYRSTTVRGVSAGPTARLTGVPDQHPGSRAPTRTLVLA